MYCSNLYKTLQISCLCVGTYFLLIKFHGRTKEKLIALLFFLSKRYFFKWSLCARKVSDHSSKCNKILSCLSVLWSLIENDQIWCMTLDMISKFPRQCYPTKKTQVYIFCSSFNLYFTELTTYKNCLFLQNICLFCWFFYSYYILKFSFQVRTRNYYVSSTSVVKLSIYLVHQVE